MIEIHSITNKIFTSKTYIISKHGCDKAWIVDIGDVEPVFEYLNTKHLNVQGVFLTHAHFDHIYGLETLIEHYPHCKVYATEYTKQSLASEKLNLSRYHGDRINYNKNNVIVVCEGESITLFKGEPQMELYETPGHNPGCLTMVMVGSIFTGDAYIPGVGVTCQVPQANKEQAKQSLERIIKLAEGKRLLPGHQVNI